MATTPGSVTAKYHGFWRRFAAATAGLSLIAAACSAQQLTVTPFHKSGIYKIGETVGWNVALPDGATSPTNSYTYTVKQDNFTTIGSGSLDLSSGKSQIETSLKKPATIFMQITPPVGAASGRGRGFGRGGGGGGMLYGAVVAPLELEPSVPRPKDFGSFWEGKLMALNKVPVNPVLTPTESGKTNVEFYTVKLDSLDSHVQGYLAKPAKPGKFPAIVYYQYAGVYALDRNIALNRAAEGWLIMDVDSHDLAPDQRSGAPGNYQSLGDTNRETSYFLDMYLRDVRAAEYMASRPDWNGKILVAMGFSMGGQQSYAVAGLYPKITHMIVEVPAGGDFDGGLHGRATGYPNWPAINAQAMQAGLYFDVVNFAPNIKATSFVALGFRDTIVAPVGEWIAFNQIKGPKQVAPMVNAGHNNQSTDAEQEMWTKVSNQWLDTLVHGGNVKPDRKTANP